MSALSPQSRSVWEAELHLQFDYWGDRTVLRSRRSRGPLVVQKPLYPEGDEVCHIYLIHPPGGVVGGDRLELEMVLRERANVLLTTPGAAKFYRSAGDTAVQRQNLYIGPGATLEWLPQDTILYSGSKVDMATTVQLDEAARFIGWDMTCLGRPASGDNYTAGNFSQKYRIMRGTAPLLIERNLYQSGQELLRANWGLADNIVVATLYALPATADMLELLRNNLASSEGIRFASTCINDVLVFRCMGPGAEPCRELLVQAWQLLREPVLQRAACVPRIWRT